MEQTISAFFSDPIAVLFVVIALGYMIGKIQVKGISLGASAVLFVALVMGHLAANVFGSMSGIPASLKAIQELGVILFVYAIGLKNGPRFFRVFKSNGLKFSMLGLTMISSTVILAVILKYALDIKPVYMVGMFAGSLTSTPGLAAAIDAMGDATASVAYGVAYPFGVVGVVLFVQLLPRILRADLDKEHAEYHEKLSAENRLELRQFKITNQNCDGKLLAELHIHHFSKSNISRIKRGSAIIPAMEDMPIFLNDILLAIGPEKELDKLEIIFGESVEHDSSFTMDSKHVVGREVYMTEQKMTGKPLRDLRLHETYGITITRIKRHDVEFVASGSSVMEIGDLVRIVGSEEACKKFITDAGLREQRLQETNVLSFSVGILIGIFVGVFIINLPGKLPFKLGVAGGPLLAALIIGHYGRIGRLSFRTPIGAINVLRELGLAFFLAGAGLHAGQQLLAVLAENGMKLFIVGAIMTIFPMFLSVILARFVFKFKTLTTMGLISGAMTSTPALGAITNVTDSDLPSLTYATVYPVAVVAMTISAQILANIL